MSRNLLATLLLTTMVLASGCATQKVVKPEAPVNKVARDTAIDMVPVKGGCFQMGDQLGVGRPDEKPVHEVCLDDFYIGKYEVTQAQWAAVMKQNPAHFKECGPDCPVENVAWSQAQEFIKKLNAMTGKHYRLPTEAEWEYAARSGGQKEEYSGVHEGEKLGDYAWYEDNAGGKIHPVGQKKPNGLGIYDMTGNVWEWVQDLHHDEYYKRSPVKNPQGAGQGMARVTRGGSFNSAAWHLRVTDRGRLRASRANEGLGFRLALPK